MVKGKERGSKIKEGLTNPSQGKPFKGRVIGRIILPKRKFWVFKENNKNKALITPNLCESNQEPLIGRNPTVKNPSLTWE